MSFGASLVAQSVKNLPAMQETRVQSLCREDALEKGHDNSLQYSCLEKSVDRVWQATVHEVAKSRTRLRDQHFHLYTFTWIFRWHHSAYDKMEPQKISRDFPGPVVKNPPCRAWDMGVVPGRRTKTPPAMRKLSLSTTAREAVCHRKDPQDATKTQCSQIHKYCF